VNTASTCVLLTTHFSYICSIFIIAQIIITKKYKSPSHVSLCICPIILWISMYTQNV